MAYGILIRPYRTSKLLSGKVKGSFESRLNVLGRYRFKFKDRRAAQDRVEDIEIGIFRRGGNEGDLAILDILQ